MSELSENSAASKKISRIGQIVQLDDSCVLGKANSQLAIIISDESESGDEYVVASVSKVSFDCTDNKYSVTLIDDDLTKGKLDGTFTVRLDRFATLSQRFFLANGIALVNDEKIEQILKVWSGFITANYYKTVHKPAQSKEFVPGVSEIRYGGRVFDEEEIINLVDSSLDFWLTAGPYTEKFERAFAEKIGVRYCSLVNSGSSGNLLAVMALTSSKLGDRRIQKGDEVITVAAGFPTTINPILQFGAVPVFLDVTLPTYNIDVSLLESAYSERTKAVMISHALGNPFDLDYVLDFCKKHNLWLVEDNCDALGSTYHGRMTGSFGDIATSSFYPPHHITMGEGGAVYTSIKDLKFSIESFRDWGRDCRCPSGKDNTCKKRFSQQLGSLPKGYDHKYTYAHFGYNLKATDMQAAIGCAQLEKLDGFVEARRKNWQILYDGLKDLEDVFILPEATVNSEPSWFGFILTIKDPKKFTRKDIVEYLEFNKIQTRMLFAGNYLRQPLFDEMRENGQGYRQLGDLKNTDRIMNDSFWIGVYPGMTEPMLEYMIVTIKAFVKTN